MPVRAGDAGGMMAIWIERPTIEEMHALHRGTAAETLGIEFVHVGDDSLSARMPVDRRTVQPYGIVHGGASVLLAETLGSIGALYCIDRARFLCLGQEVNANHLRPAQAGWVTGEARPVHLGRRSQVWTIEIRDDAGRLTCISRLTLAVVAKPEA